MNADRFNDSTYLIRRKVFKIFGGAFHIYNSENQLVLFSNMKALKLKEDIRIYADEHMQEEIIKISTKAVIDFSATYHVYISATGELMGSFRRKGLKSILKDEWLIFDKNGNEIGLIQEDSTFKAIVRRVLTNLVPQRFDCYIRDNLVCTYKQNFNPFVHKLIVDFTHDKENLFDRRLGLAAGVLLNAIESRQS